jgi:hypothetical protein
MHLSKKESPILKEKQTENKVSLSNTRRIINKTRKIRPKNLRKKISQKRIKKVDLATKKNNPLFFNYSLPLYENSLTNKGTLPEKAPNAFCVIQHPFLVLAFLQPLLMQIYIALLQQKLLITYHKNLWNKTQTTRNAQVSPVATLATGFWQTKKSTDRISNQLARSVMKAD